LDKTLKVEKKGRIYSGPVAYVEPDLPALF